MFRIDAWSNDPVENQLPICKLENETSYHEAQTVKLHEEIALSDGPSSGDEARFFSDRTPTVLLHRLTDEELDRYQKMPLQLSKLENENERCPDSLSGLTERFFADSFGNVTIKIDDRVEDGDIDDNAPPPMEYPCSYCGLPFVCRTRLKKHELDHQSIVEGLTTTDKRLIPIRCFICDKTYKNKYILQTHLTRIHAKDRHQCSACQKTFPRHALLVKHFRSHHYQETSSDLTSVEYVDGKASSEASSAADDVLKHKEDKEPLSSVFSCEDCVALFATAAELFSHVRDFHSVNVESLFLQEDQEEEDKKIRIKEREEEWQRRLTCGKECVVRHVPSKRCI